MRLKSCRLRNFMGFSELDVPLDGPMTILLADNGAGKSTILKAIRIAVGSWLLGIPDPDVGAPTIKKWMLHRRLERRSYELVETFAGDASVEVTGTIVGRELCWSRGLRIKKGARTTWRDARVVKDLAARAVEEGSPLPLFGYYGVKRRSPSVFSPSSQATPRAPTRAYLRCLDGDIDFGERLARFKRLALQALTRPGAEAVYEELCAVLVRLLPGVESVAYEVDYDSPVVKFKPDVSGGGYRALQYLSDGYLGLFTIGLDLALRAIQLNPDLGAGAMAETEGVVLIDEVALNLHPSWKAQVARGLRSAFPRVQFILSTHSPMVALGAPDDAQVLLIEHTEEQSSIRQLSVHDIGATYDEALRGPAFGLASTYAPRLQELLREREQLLQEPQRHTSKIQENTEELQEWVGYRIVGDGTPATPPTTSQIESVQADLAVLLFGEKQ